MVFAHPWDVSIIVYSLERIDLSIFIACLCRLKRQLKVEFLLSFSCHWVVDMKSIPTSWWAHYYGGLGTDFFVVQGTSTIFQDRKPTSAMLTSDGPKANFPWDSPQANWHCFIYLLFSATYTQCNSSRIHITPLKYQLLI